MLRKLVQEQRWGKSRIGELKAMAIKSVWFPRCLELFIGRLVYYSQLLVLAYLDIRSAR